jgi:hypothetical protein
VISGKKIIKVIKWSQKSIMLSMHNKIIMSIFFYFLHIMYIIIKIEIVNILKKHIILLKNYNKIK